MNTSRHRSIATAPIVVAVVGLLVIASVGVAELTRQEPRTIITVHALRPTWETHELIKEADAIAILEPTGSRSEHWNSADNRQWSDERGPRGPWIYRDEQMRVVRAIRGVFPETLTLRGVGGTVGDVRMDYPGQVDWQPGRQYLVLLEQEDTPTQTGVEKMWTVLQLELGAFVADGPGQWRNPETSLMLAEADLQ